MKITCKKGRAHRHAPFYIDVYKRQTVYYGSTDFRFKNNTNYPVKIVTRSYDQGGKRKLTVEIYGTNETGCLLYTSRCV